MTGDDSTCGTKFLNPFKYEMIYPLSSLDLDMSVAQQHTRALSRFP